jgi:hypothetical protein
MQTGPDLSGEGSSDRGELVALMVEQVDQPGELPVGELV